ncbi:MAG TPA: tripartite tricarboxylate transporter substrate binding protein [Burkholderiales bacterium]|nr:tripartite tricarboxylate transporter substrate binding protein [Burkholderiales bacterium]
MNIKADLGCVALVCALLPAWPASAAEAYPNKPIRLIVPQPPGGTSDILARVLASKLAENLHQQIIIDNRAGASGTIGTDLAAKSPPDGYTLVLVYTTHATTPGIYGKLPYDPVADFAPITLAAAAPLLLVVHPKIPVTSVKELIAYAKTRPGEVNFCSAGNGSGSHLAGELFNTMTGVKLTHIPYKGSGLAITELIGGQVQLMFAGIVPIDPHVKSGRVRSIAVTSAKRSVAIPQVPTIAESGLPGFEVVGWYGVLAPARTPHPIVARLHNEFVKILQTQDIRDRLSSEGAEPVGNTPAEFTAFIKTDIGRWAKVIKAAGAKLD